MDTKDGLKRIVAIWVVFLAVLGLGWGPPGSELYDMTPGVGGGVGGRSTMAFT